MRPLNTSFGPPPGYVMEAAIVAYGSKRTFTVAREAQRTYEIGQPLVLLQDGKFIPAVVQRCFYNGSVTTITVNAEVSASILGVMYDNSQSYTFGVDLLYTSALYHFNSATLYDASLNARDAGAGSGLTVYGGGGTLISSSPTPMFGSGCFSFTGTQGYGDLNFPFFLTGQSQWCVEGFFWDRPTGDVLFTNDQTYQTNLSFSGNYPTFYNNGTSITSSIALNAAAWNHVAWVRDAGTYYRIYVNGVPAAVSGSGITMYGQLYSLFGQARYTGSWSWSGSFSGKVDELRITRGYSPYNGAYSFTPAQKTFGPDFR